MGPIGVIGLAWIYEIHRNRGVYKAYTFSGLGCMVHGVCGVRVRI